MKIIKNNHFDCIVEYVFYYNSQKKFSARCDIKIIMKSIIISLEGGAGYHLQVSIIFWSKKKSKN